MTKKNWIMVKRGLSEDPKHRQAMGNRIWLFLHMIDRCDWETGIAHDWRDEDEASDMGIAWRTLQHQRQELEELGYITCIKRRAAQDIIIHNWINPRNYAGKTLNAKSTRNDEFDGDETTQNQVVSDDESTRKSTRKSTRYPITDSGTPTSNSWIMDQESNTSDKKKSDSNGFYPLAVAISQVCQMDLNKNKGMIFAEAKRLNESPEQVLEHYGPGAWWYLNDWRGKKGQPPKPSQIRETWGQWQAVAAARPGESLLEFSG